MPSTGMGLTATGVARQDSMSLLWRLADDALDPGYAEAAARRPLLRTERRSTSLGRSLTLAAALLGLGALLFSSLKKPRPAR